MSLSLRHLEKKIYEQFKFILGNRLVKKAGVNKLRRDIEDNGGKLPDTKEWILVINNKNEIVDGQCHWQAVMRYNEKHPKTPISSIPCVIECDAGLERAKEINNGRSRWNDMDYIDSWIALGHEDYARLKYVLETDDVRKAGLGVVYSICSGDMEDKSVHKKLVDGTFKMKRSEESSIEMALCVAKCKKQLSKVFGYPSMALTVFLRCLLINDNGRKIDYKRLANKVNCPNVGLRGFKYSYLEDDIVNNINLVYNERLSEEKRIDIVGCYLDVKSYNHLQARHAVRLPVRKSYTNASSPKKNELEDDGVHPV